MHLYADLDTQPFDCAGSQVPALAAPFAKSLITSVDIYSCESVPFLSQFAKGYHSDRRCAAVLATPDSPSHQGHNSVCHFHAADLV